MTPSPRKVVPFERPAAYWAARARQYHSPQGLPNAARLLRKALESKPDAAMALELSRVYASMGCCTAAERWLARAVTQDGLTGSACFALGCCALDQGEEALAEDALDACLRLDPQGPYAQQAQDLLEYHAWPQGERVPRGARSEVLLERAQRAMAAGAADKALDLARRAYGKCPTGRSALLMGTLMQGEAALPYLTYARQRLPGEQPLLLLLARACFQAGNPSEGNASLQLARLLTWTLPQTEAYCTVAWEAGHAEQALTLVGEQLTRFPASADYLRLKYLCLTKLGREEEAKGTLQALLEVDPDDAAARWYRRHPGDAPLFGGRSALLGALGCALSALPRRLTPGPLNRVLHLMVMLLADTMDATAVYQMLPPLWRALNQAQKRACDDRSGVHYPFAFSLYLLLRANQPQRAAELYAALPGKRRALRALKHFVRLMNKE